MPAKRGILLGALALALASGVDAQITEPSFVAGAATPVVEQTETSEYGTTYQLSLELSSDEANVYSIYASSDSPAMTFPAAYNSGLGGDIGVSAVIAPEDAYDSWLTVGDVDGGVVSSIGLDTAA